MWVWTVGRKNSLLTGRDSGTVRIRQGACGWQSWVISDLML